MKIKLFLLLSAFLGLTALFFQENQALPINDLQIAVNPEAASLYFIGIGSTYLVEWLMDSVGKQGFAPDANRPLGKTEQDRELLKLEAQSTAVKAAKQGLYTGLRIYLEKLLNASGYLPSESIKLLMRSYDAGGMIDYLRWASSKTLDVLKDIAKTAGQSTSQLGNLTLKGAQFQVGQLLNGLLKATKKPSIYRYSLDYPLKASGSTALTCGPQDRYCTQKRTQSEQEVMTQELQELTESAEKFVIANTRLMLQAGTLTAGILFAYLSFHVGLAVSQFLVSTALPESALGPAIKAIVQKTIARALEVTSAERLKDWFIKFIAKTRLLEQQGNMHADALIAASELENILKTAGAAVVAKEAALPAQVDSLKHLLDLKFSVY